ncbi:MAG: hypothetical protein JSR99_04055 [Proteobacteria bacterium]|nr:hypothetical protein [Pseudomonadota bacterium]
MLPDDVFRDRLEQTLIEIETHITNTRECAAVEVIASPHYWRMVVMPFFPDTCPFELIVKADQKFSIRLADQTFEDRAIEDFGLFLKLLRAIEAGRVEKILKFNAMTEELVAIAMRVSLELDRDWRGEHRLAPIAPSEEWRMHRYLPYRR